MYRKNSFFFIIVFLAVGIMYLFLPEKRFQNERKESKLPRIEKICQITICADRKSLYSYEKVHDSEWMISSPLTGEADASSIEKFLAAVNKISFSTPISSTSSSRDELDLTDETTYILFETRNGERKKLILGKVSNDLLYLRLSGEDEIYTADTRMVRLLPDRKNPWISRQITDFKKGQIKKVIIESSDYRRTEIQKKQMKWLVNGLEARQYEVEFMIASLTGFRADRFPETDYVLPDEEGAIRIIAENGTETLLKVFFLPDGNYIVRKAGKDYLVFSYRLKPFFQPPSRLYSEQALIVKKKDALELKLDDVRKDVGRTDVGLEITRPASDNTLLVENETTLQYGAKGVSLSDLHGNSVFFVLDGSMLVIRNNGMPAKLSGLKPGCHLVVGGIRNSAGAVYKSSITKRYFFVSKETRHEKFPFIKIVSPDDSVIPASGKVLVDFIINDIDRLQQHRLFYFINENRVLLRSFQPFIIENIPACEVVLKLQIEDEQGNIVASDSRKLIFK